MFSTKSEATWNLPCYCTLGLLAAGAGPRVIMSEELETAKRYRLHAQELRISAESMPEIATTLRSIAIDYERLASCLEDIDSTNSRLR